VESILRVTFEATFFLNIMGYDSEAWSFNKRQDNGQARSDGRMAFVPEGQGVSSQVRSAWLTTEVFSALLFSQS
jgi:hypothetical protein